MKKIALGLLTLLFVISFTAAEAQSLPKKEKKARKKEIKTYNAKQKVVCKTATKKR